METGSDIVNLVVALSTAIPALVASAVGLAKIKSIEQTISMQVKTSHESHAQAGDTHVDGRTYVNVPPTTPPVSPNDGETDE